MHADAATINEFLARLGHRVALVGRKPINAATPSSYVIWPAEQFDAADQASWLADQYHSVYVQLNPLADELLSVVPPPGVSIRDAMIARRTRVLIDIDGHPPQSKELAALQKDAIRERYGPPVAETDSGNGYGLIYTCDLPNDDPAKQRISLFLHDLKSEFSCVDHTCSNAGRLTRLIGTPNRSIQTGDRIPTRLI